MIILGNMGLKNSIGLGLLWLLSLHGCLPVCLTAQLPDIFFVVKEVEVDRQCHTQSLLTVNGKFPGETITVNRGDSVRVVVQNDGTDSITIHWHGLKQLANPWSDGPEYITQNPIPSGGSFTYTLVFSDEEGTLWWHAHSDWSRYSVHGAIVVLPPLDRPAPIYPFTPQPDFTQTIILGSWFKNMSVMQIHREARDSGGNLPEITAFTINGYPGLIDQHCIGGSLDIYTLEVESNKNYHFRIVNAVLDEEMFFAIAGHSFKVVGMDGAYLNALPSDYIMITPGNTMDIIFTTNADPTKAYYIGAKHFLDSSFGAGSTLITRAILKYPDYLGDESPIDLGALLPDDTKNATYADAFTDKLRTSGLTGNPNFPIDVPQDSDITKKYLVTISVNTLPCPDNRTDCQGPQFNSTGVNGVHSASLSNQRFMPPTETSILHAYHCDTPGIFTEDFPFRPPVEFNYTGDTKGNEDIPIKGTKVMSVNKGDAVEIVFQGTNVGNSENHPMHVHGYNFYLVGSARGNYDPANVKTYNLTSPAQANTFGVPNKGWLAVRFWANNPGVWFMHCHLERHATWGMTGVLLVRDPTAADGKGLLPPPADYPVCP